jgi:hypothetical protein
VNRWVFRVRNSSNVQRVGRKVLTSRHKHQTAEAKGLLWERIQFLISIRLGVIPFLRLDPLPKALKSSTRSLYRSCWPTCAWGDRSSFIIVIIAKTREKMFQLDSVIDWWAVSVIPCTWLADCLDGAEKSATISFHVKLETTWRNRSEGCES